MDSLLSTHPVKDTSRDPKHFTNFPASKEEELLRAAFPLKNRKAPEPDVISAEALRAITGSHPQLLLRV